MTTTSERAAAQELLDAAAELTSGRWIAAQTAYLRTVGYQVGDRVAIGTDPRFVIIGTVVGRTGPETGYVVRPASGRPVFVHSRDLRPIVADLLASAGVVLDSHEEPELEVVAVLDGREVVSIGHDEKSRPMLRFRDELELPEHERTFVSREGLVSLDEDQPIPCPRCDGTRLLVSVDEGERPCPECVDEEPYNGPTRGESAPEGSSAP